MLLRCGHRHACGYAGKQQAAGNGAGAAHQGAVVRGVVIQAPQGYRQTAAHGLQDLQGLCDRVAPDNQAGGAKHVFMQLGIGDEGGSVDFGQEGARLQTLHRLMHQGFGAGGELRLRARIQRLTHACSQHHMGLQGLKRGDQLGHKGAAGLAALQHQKTRVGTKLTTTQGDGTGQGLGQGFAASRQGLGRGHHGVDGAQLAVKRNRPCALARCRLQGRAATCRAGKSTCSDQRMLNQGDAHFVTCALHHAHQTGRQVQRFQCGLHQAVHAHRGLWMARMRLDHHRATGGQGRSGVTAQHRKRKRKIAGREHGDRAQRHTHALHGGVACRRATGHGRVIGESKSGALLRKTRKTAQLERGAVQLAIQPRRAQAGLLVGQGHQGFAVGLDGRGQGIEQGGARGAFAALPVGKSGVGSVHGGIDVGAGRGDQGCAQRLAGTGVKRLQSRHGVSLKNSGVVKK